jgi:hypothetical protein
VLDAPPLNQPGPNQPVRSAQDEVAGGRAGLDDLTSRELEILSLTAGGDDRPGRGRDAVPELEDGTQQPVGDPYQARRAHRCAPRLDRPRGGAGIVIRGITEQRMTSWDDVWRAFTRQQTTRNQSLSVAPNAIGASRKQLFVHRRSTSIRKLVAGLSSLADDQARRMPVR